MHATAYFQSSSERPPLRIGLLLNGGLQPAWVAEVLDQISRSNFARVELVVCNGEQRARKPLLRRAFETLRSPKARRELLFRLYALWDRRRIAGPGDPHRPTDCSGLLKDAEWMQVAPLRKGPIDRFPGEAIERIRGLELDVLLRFGFNILRGEILQAARHGIWSFHHGDNEFYRGRPPCFWELLEGNPITGAMLQVLTEDLDAGKVLYKGLFATHPSGSWSRNRLQPYWGASTFMIQKLRQLHERGWEQLETEILPPAPYRGRRRMYRAPTNWEMLRWLGLRLARRASAAALWLPRHLRCVDHWRLAVHAGGRTGLTAGSTEDLGLFRWIHPPRGHFYADPFLFQCQGKRWLFFEDFDHRTRRGSIAVAEVLGSGQISAPRRVLERPYHLSYPCVFRVGEEIYMIPETRSHGTVEMYRAARFPDEWELTRECLKVSAVDTTVWSEDGTHWFFVTLREPRAGALELWLFSSRGILDDWKPHPANPISTDVRRSRGGGAIYRDGTKLIRPSQDCSGSYGRSFTLNEILLLNEHEYNERALVTVEAPAGMTGMHTYGRLNEVEVIDGCVTASIFRVMDWGTIAGRVRRKLGLG